MSWQGLKVGKDYYQIYVKEADVAFRLLTGWTVCGNLYNTCHGTYSDFVMRKQIIEKE